MTWATILTQRLMLVPSTHTLLSLEMADLAAFATRLGVSIPGDWPPGEYDQDAIQFFIKKLTEGGPNVFGWYGWYAIRKATQSESPTLVGCGGYLGPPDKTSSVEIGYSISERWRGQGLAKELITGLVDNALRSGAARIVAHTGVDNPASIAALRRSGFHQQTFSTDPCKLEFDYCRLRE
jgi:[ribosomal protein S5]-alanine N-acetyltransferase